MCAVGKVASCEIAFIPILSSDYIKDVDKVLEIIKASNLEHTVGLLSTTVRGEKERIFNLIREIYDSMEENVSFTMDIKLSNLCGC